MKYLTLKISLRTWLSVVCYEWSFVCGEFTFCTCPSLHVHVIKLPEFAELV